MGEALARLVGAQGTAFSGHPTASTLSKKHSGTKWSIDGRVKAPLMVEVLSLAPSTEPGFGSVQEALQALLDSDDMLVELGAHDTTAGTLVIERLNS